VTSKWTTRLRWWSSTITA